MKSYIRFFIVTISFIFLLIYIILLSKGYFQNSYEKYGTNDTVEYSENGVLIVPENAPKLKDLFPDMKEGPHQQFYSSESCLKCHMKETDIGIGVAKKIPHKIKENCTECHVLE